MTTIESPNALEYHLGWEKAAVKARFKANLKPGDIVLSVTTSQSGPNVTEYRFMTVESLTNVRFKLTGATGHNYKSRTFYFTGQSCTEPHGQARIIPFHEGMRQYLFTNKPVNTLACNFVQDHVIKILAHTS